MALTRMEKRLTKDLEQIQKHYKESFQVNLPNKELKLWHITFLGTKGSVYQDEKYTLFLFLVILLFLLSSLQFKFSPEYPIESPEVIFVGKSPDHEHIYSNGFICMSILYDEWSAALTVASVCMSIVSMLNSAKKKSRPFNDAEFCKRSVGKGPKAFIWTFDDDKA